MTDRLPKDWAPLLLRVAAYQRLVGRAHLYWPICVLLIAALNLYAPGEPTLSERLLASLMVLIAATTFWVWERSGTLEVAFMPITVGLYTINYSLPVFLMMPRAMVQDFPLPLLEPDIDKALLLVISGLLLVLLGFYAPWRREIRSLLPRVELAWENARAVEIVSCVFGLFGLVAFWISMGSSISAGLRQPIGMLGDFYFPAVIALYILYLKGCLSLPSSLCLWGILLPMRMLVAVSFSVFTFAIIVATTVFLTYATMRRRIVWTFVVVGLVGFCIMQPAKIATRKMVWANGSIDKEQGTLDKLESVRDTARVAIGIFQQLGPEAVISVSMERLASLTVFVKAVQLTPDTIPYWYGESYYPLLFKPIPRALWPEKPDEVFGNEFGHRYGFLQPRDFATSVNLPQLVEFYCNFGSVGVLLGCFLLGTFYRAVHDVFIHPRMGLGALASGLFLMASWLDFESNLSGMLGTFPILLLMIVVFHTTITAVSRLSITHPHRKRAIPAVTVYYPLDWPTVPNDQG